MPTSLGKAFGTFLTFTPAGNDDNTKGFVVGRRRRVLIDGKCTSLALSPFLSAFCNIGCLKLLSLYPMHAPNNLKCQNATTKVVCSKKQLN